MVEKRSGALPCPQDTRQPKHAGLKRTQIVQHRREVTPMAPDPLNEPIISEFAGDQDMLEIVEEFVNELPDRISTLEQLVAISRFDEVRRLAHQLKGAGAGYGFPTLGEAAGRLEATVALSPADIGQIRDAVDTLVDLCRRASLG